MPPEDALPVSGDSPAGDPPTVAPVPAGDEPTNINHFSPEALPEGWRNSWVEAAGFEGDDAAKQLGQLERYGSPSDVLNGFIEAKNKIRAGELSTGLPDNPTDDQLSEWREAHGVPPTPEEYAFELSEGLVLGEADKAILDPVMAAAHADNVPGKTLNSMVDAMLKAQISQQQSQLQDDNLQLQQTTAKLQEAWGNDYQANMQVVENVLEQLPESLRDDVKNARMPDGTALLNSPEVVAFFSDLGRQANPIDFVMPNGSNTMKGLTDEIRTMEERMGEREWFDDTEAQTRYRQLVTARDRMSA